MEQSLQDTYGPGTICFGCGPANENGLQIKSYPDGTDVVAQFHPRPEHQAFQGVLNGGIIGALFDCHMNWTAAYDLMRHNALERPPVTVTADFHVRLKKPTPYPEPLYLRAWAVSINDDRATIEAEMTVHERVTATCTATFVAVGEGHPAHDRW